ncbi:MAG: putative reverse transcriptase, partial [Streblomastix strix]
MKKQTLIDNKVGARQTRFENKWKQIGQDQLTREGLTLRWKDQLSQMKLIQIRKKREFKGEFNQLMSMQEIINQELIDGEIIPIQDSLVAFWNPIFAVSKKNGGFRKILDCRRLNSELMTETFQMDNVNSIKQIVKQGDFATSLDIHQAFHHIGVAAKSIPYLCFSFLGQSYAYIGMPFGVSIAPRVFIKTLIPLIAQLRRMLSSNIITYMDDILILNQNPLTLQQETLIIKDYLAQMGWILSMEKSNLNPSQDFEFIGWRWDSRNLTIQLKPKRRRGMIKQLKILMNRAIHNKYIRTRELAKRIGEIQFARAQFVRGALRTKLLNKLKDQEVQRSGWNNWTKLTCKVVPEITWWIQKISQNKPLSFQTPTNWASIQTDASHHGWGATCKIAQNKTMVAYNWWTREELKYVDTSNKRELMAVSRSLTEFKPTMINNQIQGIEIVREKLG